MKFSAILLAAAAGLAAAQTLEDAVPECAAKCLLDAQRDNTNYKVGDVPCFCQRKNFQYIYEPAAQCIRNECGTDIREYIPALVRLCRGEDL